MILQDAAVDGRNLFGCWFCPIESTTLGVVGWAAPPPSPALGLTLWDVADGVQVGPPMSLSDMGGDAMICEFGAATIPVFGQGGASPPGVVFMVQRRGGLVARVCALDASQRGVIVGPMQPIVLGMSGPAKAGGSDLAISTSSIYMMTLAFPPADDPGAISLSNYHTPQTSDPSQLAVSQWSTDLRIRCSAEPQGQPGGIRLAHLNAYTVVVAYRTAAAIYLRACVYDPSGDWTRGARAVGAELALAADYDPDNYKGAMNCALARLDDNHMVAVYFVSNARQVRATLVRTSLGPGQGVDLQAVETVTVATGVGPDVMVGATTLNENTCLISYSCSGSGHIFKTICSANAIAPSVIPGEDFPVLYDVTRDLHMATLRSGQVTVLRKYAPLSKYSLLTAQPS